MSKDTIHWRSIAELTNHPQFLKDSEQEFSLPAPGAAPVEGESTDGTNRRDFLKLMGFGLATVSLAACEAPVRKAIPFLAKPDNIDYSNANWYASTYMEDGEYCALLVKTKEGRPIKIEGNRLSSVTRGGTSVKVQASVLSLYDQSRFRQPQHNKKPVDWPELDQELGGQIRQMAVSGKPVVLVSPSIASPSFSALLSQLGQMAPGMRHVVYDPLPAAGIIKANQASFGKAVVPSYDFSKASVIVSFEADFLGTWLAPIEYARQFAKGRKLGKKKRNMSRFYMVEALMSLSGANADTRVVAKSSAIPAYVAALQAEVARMTGGQAAQAGTLPAGAEGQVKKMAEDLVAARGRSLVVAGSNSEAVQTLINSINYMLGNYGATINLNAPNLTRAGQEQDMERLVSELEAGRIGAVLFYKSNPVYSHPRGEAIKAALKKTVSASFAYAADETTDACAWVVPDHHFLESWGDSEPRPGFYSLTQPTITPIFNTRQTQDSLMAWFGIQGSYYDFIRQYWRTNLFPTQSGQSSFTQFWNYALHDGIYEIGRPSLRGKDFASNGAGDGDAAYEYLSLSGVAPDAFSGNVSSAANALQASGKGGLEVVLYEKVGMGSGSLANNPWLLEFPDPITRVTWENYLTISPSKAKELGVSLDEGKTSLVKLTVAGKTMSLPAVIQPGQEKETLGLALGFGRKVAGKAGEGRGQNAYPLVTIAGGAQSYVIGGATLAPTGEEYMLGHVQTSHTNAGRPVIQTSTLKEYQKDPTAGREFVKITTPDGPMAPTDITLWKTEVNKRPNHAWGMVIDLNSCIGCGACVVGCQAENNVVVVGKEEVVNRREMHWIRIDRYYSSAGTDRVGLETAAENPEVTFQPMMCQHCNNAPCETVCPVLATTHSSEGLNQMTYNRCIGTRYCANNCPYKVRRFNWFSYPEKTSEAGFTEGKFPFTPSNSLLTRMVLNPDVTVRARGVMEKCTFCIQRIQDGKLTAKKEGRRPVDGEIVTACAQACPTEAITFGDMNDPQSAISGTIAEQYSERAFHVLEEINTRPNVSYLTKIRNKA